MTSTVTINTRRINAMHNSAVDSALDENALKRLAHGVLQIPPSEDRLFMLAKPEERDAVLPLPPHLASTYCLKWANPTRIGAGAGVAYSLDVITDIDELAPARTRHLYITYMDEAGPSRCRVALAKAIQQLGPILYTAEADARDSLTADEELARLKAEEELARQRAEDEDLTMGDETADDLAER